MRRMLLTLALAGLALLARGQAWRTGSEQDFAQEKASFERYWEGRPVERGKGWKPFRRCEWFMAPRAYPDGRFDAGALLAAWEGQAKDGARLAGPVWRPTGAPQQPQRTGSGRLNCVAFHPARPLTLWVGAASGGIWRTDDGGQSWRKLAHGFPTLGVSHIAVHPQDPDILLAATGDANGFNTYSAGIIRSTDGGQNWTPTGLSVPLANTLVVQKIIIHPTRPELVWAGSNAGILHSRDGGLNWNVLLPGLFKDMEFRPGQPDVVYAAGYGGNARLYRSTDGGQTFLPMTTGISASQAFRIEMAVSPQAPQRIYAVASRSSDDGLLGVYRSDDGGGSWRQTLAGARLNLLGWSTDGSDLGGQGWYDLSIAAAPDQADRVHVGGVNLWRSDDGGTNWSLEADWQGRGVPYVHADHHYLDYHPTTGLLYSCHDGGLGLQESRSSWPDLSDGLQIAQVYKIGPAFQDSTFLLYGTQDNGTIAPIRGVWQGVLGGDGMECAVNPDNINLQYAEIYYGAIYRSINGGGSFAEITPAEAGEGAWVTPYLLAPDDPRTLYAGYERVFRSADGGIAWQPVSPVLQEGQKILDLSVPARRPEHLFALLARQLHHSPDRGQTWSRLPLQGLPDLSFTDLEVHPDDPARLWLSCSGFADGQKVFASQDGGQSWTNWSDGLPNVPANCLAFDGQTGQGCFVGTDLGVYYRREGQDRWWAYGDSLPAVIVTELELHPLRRRLLAATFGRGVWEAELLPTAAFGTDKREVGVGELVTFTDLSFWEVEQWAWDFGPGAEPPTAQGPGPHPVRYASQGPKQVSLTVTERDGQHTLRQAEAVLVRPELFVQVNPNPVAELATLKVFSQQHGTVELEILSAQGQVMLVRRLEKTENLLETPLDTRGWAMGVYLARVRMGEGQTVERFVVR